MKTFVTFLLLAALFTVWSFVIPTVGQARDAVQFWTLSGGSLFAAVTVGIDILFLNEYHL